MPLIHSCQAASAVQGRMDCKSRFCFYFSGSVPTASPMLRFLQDGGRNASLINHITRVRKLASVLSSVLPCMEIVASSNWNFSDSIINAINIKGSFLRINRFLENYFGVVLLICHCKTGGGWLAEESVNIPSHLSIG